MKATEHNLLIRTERPTEAQREAFHAHRKLAEEIDEKGDPKNAFKSTQTVAVVTTTYGFELVTKVLRALCIPYTVTAGRPVRRRSKKCTTSTTSRLEQVAHMSDQLPTITAVSLSTTAENATAPEESNGE